MCSSICRCCRIIEQIDLGGAELVISSSHLVAQGFNARLTSCI